LLFSYFFQFALDGFHIFCQSFVRADCGYKKNPKMNNPSVKNPSFSSTPQLSSSMSTLASQSQINNIDNRSIQTLSSSAAISLAELQPATGTPSGLNTSANGDLIRSVRTVQFKRTYPLGQTASLSASLAQHHAATLYLFHSLAASVGLYDFSLKRLLCRVFTRL
jgi:hypothetical protein